MENRKLYRKKKNVNSTEFHSSGRVAYASYQHYLENVVFEVQGEQLLRLLQNGDAFALS